jgi:signal transduction histidine kinase
LLPYRLKGGNMSDIRILAHDIDNKLTALLGFSTLGDKIVACLPASHQKDQLTKILKVIKESAEKIKEACDDHITEKIETVDIVETMMEVSKNDEIKTELMVISKPVLDISKSKFIRMFENILKNAKEQGSTCVSVEVRSTGIIFRDNGGGIPEDILHKLKMKEKVTSKKNGHGYGVGSMRMFCEARGWSISFDNGINQFNHPHKSGQGLVIKIGF